MKGREITQSDVLHATRQYFRLARRSISLAQWLGLKFSIRPMKVKRLIDGCGGFGQLVSDAQDINESEDALVCVAQQTVASLEAEISSLNAIAAQRERDINEMIDEDENTK